MIITRMEGRTAVPERERIRKLAAHKATMVIFLSAGMLKELEEELLSGGYNKDTPAAIVYKATWPEEKLFRCKLGELSETGRQERISKTALIIVGDTAAQKGYERSKLYHPQFETGFRNKKD